MSVKVKYLASLRDRLGRSEDTVDAMPDMTVMAVWSGLWPDTAIPENTLVAVNQEYSDPDTEVKDGDEIAFFPPVTGG